MFRQFVISVTLLFSITVAASDGPTSYSECIFKHVSANTPPEVAKIIESACKDQFPSEEAIPIEDARCADVKKLLTDWDAYVGDNFNTGALAKQRANAGVSGLISSGTGSGTARARANFDRQIAAQLRNNQERRMRIVSLIAESGC
jgi:hypothetical protein